MASAIKNTARFIDYLSTFVSGAYSVMHSWANSYKKGSIHERNLEKQRRQDKLLQDSLQKQMQDASAQVKILRDYILQKEQEYVEQRKQEQYLLGLVKIAQVEAENIRLREQVQGLENTTADAIRQANIGFTFFTLTAHQLGLSQGHNAHLLRQLARDRRESVAREIAILREAFPDYPWVYLDERGVVLEISPEAYSLLRLEGQRVKRKHISRFLTPAGIERAERLEEDLAESYLKNVRVKIGDKEVTTNVKVLPLYSEIVHSKTKTLAGSILLFDRSFWSLFRKSTDTRTEQESAVRETSLLGKLERIFNIENNEGIPILEPT